MTSFSFWRQYQIKKAIKQHNKRRRRRQITKTTVNVALAAATSSSVGGGVAVGSDVGSAVGSDVGSDVGASVAFLYQEYIPDVVMFIFNLLFSTIGSFWLAKSSHLFEAEFHLTPIFTRLSVSV